MRHYDKRERLRQRAALLQKPERTTTTGSTVIGGRGVKRAARPADLQGPPVIAPSVRVTWGVCPVNPIYQQPHPFWWQER